MDTWRVAFERWDDVIDPDLVQHFGLDMNAPGAWDDVPWWLLIRRVMALLDIRDSRLTREMVRLNDDRAQGRVAVP